MDCKGTGKKKGIGKEQCGLRRKERGKGGGMGATSGGEKEKREGR